MSHSIAQSVKALNGTTLGEQIAAKKSAALTDDERTIVECNAQTVQRAAASLHPGTPVDSGSQVLDDMVVGSAAKGFQVKATAKFTEAQVNAEAGPGASPEARIAAVLRLQRKVR